MAELDFAIPKVEFVSYTGGYPTLCSGVLTVLIDGKEYKFGHEPCSGHYDREKDEFVYDDDNYQKFWRSGGRISRAYNAIEGPWEEDKLYSEELPETLKALVPILLQVFNENVEHGCCGGCI